MLWKVICVFTELFRTDDLVWNSTNSQIKRKHQAGRNIRGVHRVSSDLYISFLLLVFDCLKTAAVGSYHVQLAGFV